MKIRIFTLAKELNMDSKVLIEYCQKLGIILKNSALASISPEEKERVLALIKQGSQSAAPAPEKAESLAPVRETVRVGTKVPTLRNAPGKGRREDEMPYEPAVPEAEVAPQPEPEPAPQPEPEPQPVVTTATAPVTIQPERPEPTVTPRGATTPAAPVSPPSSEIQAPVRPPPARLKSALPPKITGPSRSSTKAPAPAAQPSPAPAAESPASDAAAPEESAPETPQTPLPAAAATEPPAPAASVPPASQSAAAEPAVSQPTATQAPASPPAATQPAAPEPPPPAAGKAPAARPAPAPVPQTGMRPQAPPPASSGTPAPPQPSKPAPPPPLRREDYMPATGTRAMVSRPSPPSLGQGGQPQKKPKERPRPILPDLPSMPVKPVAQAPVEQAQKPEIRFPAGQINAERPLSEQLKQIVKDRKAPKKPGEMTDEAEDARKKKAGAGAAGGGSLLNDRQRRQNLRSRSGGRGDDDDERGRGRSFNRHSRKGQKAVALKSAAVVEPPITIRNLSLAMGRPAAMLLGSLMRRGIKDVNINSALADEDAIELAMELGVDLQIKHERDIEEELEMGVPEGTEVQRTRRPPIVTILGHVDHGKTTLLDKIRSTNVAGGELGGITQHIAAYQIEHEGQKITFLDTPGHAAFAEMRARGANVTDIAVLVVAANDGVMPQTVEALNHARAAGVPIIVAMNKSDLPDRNEQRVLQDLAAQNLLAAEWGGDTEVVRTSGQTGQGIEELLSTILTLAELNEVEADASRPGRGVCLEAFRDEGRGPVAWLIVEDGTLRKGDVLLCGPAYGRIRGMYNDHDQEINEAPPSTPLKVSGLDMVPWAGDKFYAMDDLDEARTVAESRRQRGRQEQLASRSEKPRTLEDILSRVEAGKVQELGVILKADTPGSVEALKSELAKFSHPEVRVNLLHAGIGGVNESDVYLAAASSAIIVAFHVVPEDRAQALAEREGVEIRKYGIIYEVTDDIKKALEGMLKPEVIEVATGRAIVLQTFSISRFGKIAGCRVLNGTIDRSHRIRIVRDQRALNDYAIQSLRRGKEDTKEVREGMECGIRLENFDDVKEGDLLQAYKLDEIKRTL